MRYALTESVIKAVGRGFDTADTVTILLYNSNDGSVVPVSTNTCTQWGTTGIFEWDFQNITTFPTTYGNYFFVMKNAGETVIVSGQVIIGGYINDIANVNKTILMIPFEVDLETLPINKGDSWEPEIKVYTNSVDLNVAVELSDMTTTIYKATSDITDRGDGETGGDSQVLLVAQGDTFQVFRIFLSGIETESFDSRYVDIKITAQTKDGKTQTIKKKISFTETSAIDIV